MIENLNSKLFEHYEIRRKTSNAEEIDITLEEIKKFCIILNQIKEDRPTTNCKIWISLENETR